MIIRFRALAKYRIGTTRRYIGNSRSRQVAPARATAPHARPTMVVVVRLGPALLSRFRVVTGDEYRLVEATSWAEPTRSCTVGTCPSGGRGPVRRGNRRRHHRKSGRFDPKYFSYGHGVHLRIADTGRDARHAGAQRRRHQALCDQRSGRRRQRDFGSVSRSSAHRAWKKRCSLRSLTALTAVQTPVPISDAIRALFRTPRRFQTAEDVAVWAGVSRQYFNRCLAVAGVVPLRILVVAARVLRAYQYAQVPGLTLADVAARLRYTDTRTLTRHVRELTGTTLSSWSASISPAECVAQIRARLGMGANQALVLLASAEREVKGVGTGG